MSLVTAPPPTVVRTGGGDRLHVLDLLRFAAAISVLGLHYVANHPEVWAGRAGAFGPATGVLTYGWLGVETFFVISGFVICMSSWGRPLSHLFISRVSRLMPAYMAAVLITATVITLMPMGRPKPHISHTLVNLTMLQRFLHVPATDAVSWTLFIELKFYVLFAIVVAFGVTYRRVVLFCVLWSIAALFAVYQDEPLLTAIVEPRTTALFVAGVVLYLIHRFGADLLLWCMLGVSVAVELANLAQRAEIRTGFASYPIAMVLMLSVFALMTGVALGWFDWVRWPGLVTLGALTYPVYLLHHEIGLITIQRLSPTGIHPWLLFTLVVAAVLLLSHAVAKLVERPLSRALRHGLAAGFATIRAADARPPRG
ncbi:acyltransferase family protein [Actinoplanes sp. CA-030573]|uniref:acyltransferase family protein n=1 Tax=Actinoplanes sp. CA-030573 TaxID=3239898 RepID=UPI003D8D12A5